MRKKDREREADKRMSRWITASKGKRERKRERGRERQQAREREREREQARERKRERESARARERKRENEKENAKERQREKEPDNRVSRWLIAASKGRRERHRELIHCSTTSFIETPAPVKCCTRVT